MAKQHPIGLRHARQICQMALPDRLAFLAEGLPVILNSAEGFWAAAEALREHPREADVLEGLASEEAAKVLILIDMQRCPWGQAARAAGTSVGWFYNHLARLLYADAVGWRPADKGELRRYIDGHRRTHGVDGAVGEFIMPTGPVYDRERRLYADVEALQDGVLMWNSPSSWKEGLASASVFQMMPPALCLARSMHRLGLFSVPGMSAVSEVWGAHPLDDGLTYDANRGLTQQLFLRLNDLDVFHEDASDDDAAKLLGDWPLPMWDFNLSPVEVPMKELEAEQERNMWREAAW